MSCAVNPVHRARGRARAGARRAREARRHRGRGAGRPRGRAPARAPRPPRDRSARAGPSRRRARVGRDGARRERALPRLPARRGGAPARSRCGSAARSTPTRREHSRPTQWWSRPAAASWRPRFPATTSRSLRARTARADAGRVEDRQARLAARGRAALGRCSDSCGRAACERSRVWMPLGKRVAIVGADLAAIELAEFLAAARAPRGGAGDAASGIAPEVGAEAARRAHAAPRPRAASPSTPASRSSGSPSAASLLRPRARREPRDRRRPIGDPRRRASSPTRTLLDRCAVACPSSTPSAIAPGLGLIRKATEEAARVACAL